MVSKGNISGFGKLELDVPDGYIAEQVEINGSSFGATGTKVKFIWMAMPTDTSFTVVYKLKPLFNGKGVLLIGGRLIYAFEGEPRKHVIQPLPIAVGVGTDAVAAFMGGAPDSVLMSFVADSKPLSEGFEGKRKGDDLYSGVKQSSKSASNDFRAANENSSRPEDSSLSSFKLQSADGKQTNGALSSDNGSSRTQSGSEKNAGSPSVSKKRNAERNSELQQNALSSGSSPGQAMTGNTNYSGRETVLLRPKQREEVRTNDDKSLFVTPGVTFKVQVAAFRKGKITAREVQSLYNISEILTIENDEGMSKHLTTEFTLYRSAKTKANELRETTSAPGPFVVSYLNGERVHISKVLSTKND